MAYYPLEERMRKGEKGRGKGEKMRENERK
jgi:hypothetical protein